MKRHYLGLTTQMTKKKEMSMTNQTAKTKEKRKMTPVYLVRIGVFSAIAFIVMYFEFPLGTLFPAFLQVDLSETVVFIGGVAFGPLAVVLIELIKNILHLLMKGNTLGIGEMANVIIGIGFILPAVVVTRKIQSIKGVIAGFGLGIVMMVVIASLTNLFIFFPLYASLLHFPITNIFKSELQAILIAIAPFNAIKGVIVAGISILLHQSLKPVYQHLK